MVTKAKKTSTRKPRASKAKKSAPKVSAKAVVKAPVKAAAAPAKAPPAPKKVAATTEKVEVTLSDAFVQVLGQLTSLRSQLTNITGQVRALQKRADRELRAAQKLNRKRTAKSGTRAPSGFVKPTKISEELAAFLGKEWPGTEMARTQVTREINTYIRAHNLQDPKNGRRILADKKLRQLLKLQKDDELTYFNLQRYMSPHFAKATKNVVKSS